MVLAFGWGPFFLLNHFDPRVSKLEKWYDSLIKRVLTSSSNRSPSSLRSSGPTALVYIRKKALRSFQRREINMYCTYILKCSDNSLYVGCTNNLEKRIVEHNSGKRGAHYTKIRRPVELLRSEMFNTLLEARRREKEIKGWRREKKLILINS